jgi:glycosyltransferase involved in cell wall biosynthesis
MARRPRALMIASAIPDRTGNGLAMRLGIFLEALAKVAEVDLVVLSVAGSADAPAGLPASLGVSMRVLPANDFADTQFMMLQRLRDPASRVRAFRAYGRPSFSASVSPALLSHIGALGRERNYDLVHVGRIYMAEAGLAAATGGTCLSLDLDEDDYVSLNSIADLHIRRGNLLPGEWFCVDAEASDRMVAALGPRYKRLWISSPEDAQTLTARHPTLDPVLIRNAVEFPASPVRRDDGATLLFVGSFGYPPNVEGVLWFARDIWPRLKARAGKPLRILIVGGDPPSRIKNLARKRGLWGLLGARTEFSVLGRVTDLGPVYERTTLALAPLRAGRGTRLKLLEAAAEAVPIAATSDAARGLPLEPPWAWIGDDADAFADACVAALGNPEERLRRVEQGRALIAAEYDRAKVVQELAARFEGLMPGGTAGKGR